MLFGWVSISACCLVAFVRAVWLHVCCACCLVACVLVRAVWLRVYECVLYGYGCISACVCARTRLCV